MALARLALSNFAQKSKGQKMESTELVKYNPINKNHNQLGQELLDKVKANIELGGFNLSSYSVKKDWGCWIEQVEVDVSSKEKLYIRFETKE